MNEQIGTFILFTYIVIWIGFALMHEDKEQNKLIIWAITFFWPIIIMLRILNKD